MCKMESEQKQPDDTTTTAKTPSLDSDTKTPEAEEKKEEDKPKKAEKKKPNKEYENWPVRGIKEPHPNDVLYGRGGGTNHHPGNKRYRKMVEERKVEYVSCKRLDKPLVALGIIREWRGQEPPGRFLKMDEKTGLWNDVGDKKAREKTSQALREKAPQIRRELDKEHGKDDSSDEELTKSRTTRFAAGTYQGDGPQKPGVVERIHSLGTDFVDETGVSLEDFTWNKEDSKPKFVPPGYAYPDGRVPSNGSYGGMPPPGGRMMSGSSFGMPPPDARVLSGGYAPPMPYPTHSPEQTGSWGRFGSWGSAPPPGVQFAGYSPQSSWSNRDHSLAMNPLSNASCNAPAYPFDHRNGSWGPPQPPPYPNYPPPPYPPHEFSGNYTVDPAVASQWSGQDPREIAKTMSNSSEERDKLSSPTSGSRRMPKPEIVKRATSNQNETLETKRGLEGGSVKKANLNREGSLASNRLKKEYIPGYFDSKREVEQLTNDMEQSTLGSPKPQPLTDRMTTLDVSALDLDVKPVSLASTSRSTTIEALNIDFDDDNQVGSELPKPHSLTADLRLTTTDLIDIMNEPV